MDSKKENKKDDFEVINCASTSNEMNPDDTDEGSKSPVLSNSKKSFLRMAKYKSRQKQKHNITTTQDSCASFIDSKTMNYSTPVLLDSQNSVKLTETVNQNTEADNMQSRFKRLKELQQQKKFHYGCVPKTTNLNNTKIVNDEQMSESVLNICDNVSETNNDVRICAGFNLLSGKPVFINQKELKRFTKILSEVEVHKDDPMLQGSPEPSQQHKPRKLTNFDKKEPSKSSIGSNFNCANTVISDTQMLQAAENAESILELADDRWILENPSSSRANVENSQDFNISSINFDSQWDADTQTIINHPKENSSDENVDNLPYLDNVNTQWFFSSEESNKNKDEIPCNQTSSATICQSITPSSSQISNESSLCTTEEEPVKRGRKKLQIQDLKTFYGNLTFSNDGSTCLRQCTPKESNIEMRTKKNSWIFDVSFEQDETLGFNGKRWKYYSKKFNMLVESFERQVFPEKFNEIYDHLSDNVENTTSTNKKKTKHNLNRKLSKKKQKTNKKLQQRSSQSCKTNNDLCKQPNSGLELNNQITELRNNNNEQNKDIIDYNSLEENLFMICGSPLTESKYEEATISSNGCETTNEITELLQKESAFNFSDSISSKKKVKQNINEFDDQVLDNVNEAITDFKYIHEPGNLIRNQAILEKYKMFDLARIREANNAVVVSELCFLSKLCKLESDLPNLKNQTKMQLSENLNDNVFKETVNNVNIKNQTEFKITSSVASTSGNIKNDTLVLVDKKSVDSDKLCQDVSHELIFDCTSTIEELTPINDDFIDKVDQIFESTSTDTNDSKKRPIDSGKKENLYKVGHTKIHSKIKQKNDKLSKKYKKKEFGYATSSGSIEKCAKKFFDEIDIQQLYSNIASSFSLTSEKKSDNSSDILEVSEMERQKEFLKTFYLKYIGKKTVGFKTASGRFEKISEECLIKIKENQSKSDEVSVSKYYFRKKAKPSYEVDACEDYPKSYKSKQGQYLIKPKNQSVPKKVLAIEAMENPGCSFDSDEIEANQRNSSNFRKRNYLYRPNYSSEESSKEALPLIKITENPGCNLFSVEKRDYESANISNLRKSSNSKKGNTFLDKSEQISEESIVKVLPQLEIEKNPDYSFVSEEKQATEFANISNYRKSSNFKEKHTFLDESEQTPEASTEIVLSQTEIKENSDYSFISSNSQEENKLLDETEQMLEESFQEELPQLIIKVNQLAQEMFKESSEEFEEENPGSSFVCAGFNSLEKTSSSKSKNEEQLLTGFNNNSEASITEALPQIETMNNPEFNFVTTTKENLPGSSKSTEEQFLERLENTSVATIEKVATIDNPGFSFVSAKNSIADYSAVREIRPVFSESKQEQQKEDNMIEASTKDAVENFVSTKKSTTKDPVVLSHFENKPITSKLKKEVQILKEFENIPQIEARQYPGFRFVSGKKPETKATSIFNDLFDENLKSSKSKKEEQFLNEFKKMSDNITEAPLPQIKNPTFIPKNVKELLSNKENLSENAMKYPGFNFVSGKKPNYKPTNIFDDIFEGGLTTSFKSKEEEQFFKEIEKISEDLSEKTLSQIDSNENFKPSKSIDFGSEPSCSKHKNEEILENTRNIPETTAKDNVIKNTVTSTPVLGVKRPFNSPLISGNRTSPILKRRKLGSTIKKRSLGSVVKSCRQLNLSETCTKKAKLIFEDFDVQLKDPVNFNNNSIVKSPSIAESLKQIEETSANTSLLNTSVIMKETNKTLSNSQKFQVSPVKNNTSCETHVSSLFAFQEIETDIDKQKSLLEKEFEFLKLQVLVFEKRIQMITEQRERIKNSASSHRRQRSGCLLCKKSENINRITLKQVTNNKPQILSVEKSLNAGVDKTLLEITPQNAVNFAFFIPWWPNDNHTYPAVILTEDEAILIPNNKNFIGINEIQSGFLAMPGVDPKLVPENWIRNHYKWIIWKLASYERNYPIKFKVVTSLENVMAQLKYRYDREIDKAERSALKKILEVDDTPSKRMVLCVSDIYKLSSKQNELELTDGWYSIKAIIDAPLNYLINTNKIYIGQKLMIHGAEILNCEGCPPLETPANVRLQIHYNSTHRAAWDVKLGYQQDPGPLCINLHTAVHQGGLVGLTIVYVARIYPVCYMERGDKAIWRDKKAELQRSNEWEEMQNDLLEKCAEDVRKQMELELIERRKLRKNSKILLKDVCKLQDGRSIYEFWETCNDPDCLVELLNAEQCEALKNYQIHQKNQLNTRIQRKFNEKNTKRNVTSVLKLLITDVNNLSHSRTLSIWRPTEVFLKIKEGLVLNFYNLIVKDASNLSSTPKTRFTLNNNLDKTKFEKFSRKVTLINELRTKQLFDEFDTVGLVVEVNNEEDNKYIWITNEDYLFLLINIRNSQEIRILDSINRNTIVVLQNLVYQNSTKNYAIAQGNCYTKLCFSPFEPYIQSYMTKFSEKVSENPEEYLDNCVSILNKYKSENNLKLNELSVSMRYDTMNKTISNNKEPPKKSTEFENDIITLSDEEMSLIDFQHL